MTMTRNKSPFGKIWLAAALPVAFGAGLAMSAVAQDGAPPPNPFGAQGDTGRGAPAIVYDPAALMEPENRIDVGSPEAGARLVIVHAGNDLAREEDTLDAGTLARAINSGKLRVTHLFTYTGADSSIWANLAFICGGAPGYATLREILSGDAGRAALTAVDAGGGPAPLRELVAKAYEAAGVASSAVDGCAFNRSRALAYLADWSEKRGGNAWKKVNYYDHWPIYVFDGAPLTAQAANEALARLSPEPVATSQGQPGAPAPAAPAGPPPGDPDQHAPAPSAGSTPRPPAPTPGAARVPAVLRGVYAPDLRGCLDYAARVEGATTLDDLLPAPNPPGGGPLGTVLLTSNWLHLMTPTADVCALTSTKAQQDGGSWQAEFTCAAGARAEHFGLGLSQEAGAGPAPRLSVETGAGTATSLVQCRPLGLLGSAAASLWAFDEAACSVVAPTHPADFVFAMSDDGSFQLSLRPAHPLAPVPAGSVTLELDGSPLDARVAEWTGNARTIDLGKADAAIERLARGLFLDVLGPRRVPIARLALFGSGRAMERLSACLPSPDTGEN